MYLSNGRLIRCTFLSKFFFNYWIFSRNFQKKGFLSIISYLDGVGIGNGFVGTKDLILKSSGRDLSEESVLFV